MFDVECRCGRRHYGLFGAAGLVLRDATGLILMTLRSAGVQHPHTWAFPGGALEAGETPAQAALREMTEEVGVPEAVATVGVSVIGTDHIDWRYTYVLATLAGVAPAPRLNWEVSAVQWVAPSTMADLVLHPDLRSDLPLLLAALDLAAA